VHQEVSTRELTAAIASGDTEAFACLYRERFDQMYAWARQATRRDEAFCLDAVQDAFVRIIKGMKPINSEGELMAWLRRVTLTACYDQLRRDNRRAARERSASAPESETRRNTEQLEWIAEQIASLDEPSAALLEMRYRFGWTLERIGRATGLKAGAVDGRLSRTTQRLRAKAGETNDE